MEENSNMMNSEKEILVNDQKSESVESPKEELKADAVVPEREELKKEDSNADVENTDAKELEDEVKAEDVVPEKEEEPVKKVEKTEVLLDYKKLSLDELVSETNKVVNLYEFGKSKKIIDIIKNTFYAKLNKEREDHREVFLAAEGKIEDYMAPISPAEDTFKELLKVFKDKRALAVAELDKLKEKNYKIKLEIVDEISGLINSTEHFNTVYQSFKKLQLKWKEIKQVPSTKNKELNSKYQFALNQFYDYLNINKELRELDLKKNQTQKEEFCSKAEGLIDSKNAKSAFIELQDLHQRWKDVGPVIEEHKEALWERFKEATKAINDKFQDYQNKQKEERDVNLEKKTGICEEVELVIQETYSSPKEWESGSAIIIGFQKEWKKTGMVPAKDNESIYKRFKEACDKFLSAKNEFFKGIKSQQRDNLDLKIALIEKVETLKESKDWDKTKNEIIQIQKQWKNIGPIPRKKSDAVWKRFRGACDAFFNNKEAHYVELHGDENENLEKKQVLIKEIEAYKHKEDVKESIRDLKVFQDQWKDIGFVPIKNKNDIQEVYRTAINNQFDALNIDASERDLARLRVKLDQHIESPNAQKLIFGERNKLVGRVKQVEADIQQLENNIGFFSAGTAKGLLKEYENKIEVNKKNLEALKDKVRLIDKYIED